MDANDLARSGLPEPPPPPAPKERSHLSVAAALAAFAVGLLTNAALNGPSGLGLTLVIAALASVVIVSCRPRIAGIAFLATAVIVSVGATVRTSPTLVALIMLTSAGLLGLGAAFSAGGQPLTTTLRAYLQRGRASIGAIPAGAVALVAPARMMLSREGRVSRGLLRSIVLIVPVVITLMLLLGSADAVFANYLRAPLEATPEALPSYMARIALGALICSTFLVRAARPVDTTLSDAPAVTPWPDGREWTALLGVVVVLFAGFVAVQLAVFFGGRAHVVNQQGLTYAEYARSGFWQLLAAVAIGGLVIAGAWSAGARRRTRTERRVFTAFAILLIGLVLVVLTSAFQRLELYERTYGFTWPRLMVHAAILSLGVVMVCAGVAVGVGRARWLPTAMVAIGVITVVTLTTIDPDRVIASRNIERFHETGRLDISELTALSPDAAPALVDALPSLPTCEQAILRRELAIDEGNLGTRDGWAAFNVGRARARSALTELGPFDADRFDRAC